MLVTNPDKRFLPNRDLMDPATELSEATPSTASTRSLRSHTNLGFPTLSNAAVSERTSLRNGQADRRVRSPCRSRTPDIGKNSVNDHVSMSSPSIRKRLQFDDKESEAIVNRLDVTPCNSKCSQVTWNTTHEAILESVFGVDQRTSESAPTVQDQCASRAGGSAGSGQCHYFTPCGVQHERNFVSGLDQHVLAAASNNTSRRRTTTTSGATRGRNCTPGSSSRARKTTPVSSDRGRINTPASARRTNKSTPRRFVQDTPSILGSATGGGDFTPHGALGRRSRSCTPGSNHRNYSSNTPDMEHQGGAPARVQRSHESPPKRLHFPMPKQRKKAHWKFIDLICDDKHRAKQPLLSLYATCAWCKKCKCEIQYERSNTYHVTRHMEKFHPADLRNEKDEERQHKKRKVQMLVHRQVNSVTTSSSTDDACSPEDQEPADDLVAIWVAKSMRPFSIVENKYFLKYVQHLNQVQGLVTVRNPWKVRERVEEIAVDLRVTLKQSILDECEFYSGSSDIWTSKSKMGFICFTIHYLTREFKMRSWVLEVKRIKGKHDGDAIARSLSDTMNEWDLRIEKCTKFLRDGASNGVNACKKMGFNDMSCLAHCIHLVVGAGIVKKKCTKKASQDLLASAQTDEDIEKGVNHQAREKIDNFVEDIGASERLTLNNLRNVVGVFRKVAAYFSRSSKGSDLVKDLQKDKQQPLLPQLDSPTRWNSTYFMLQRMVAMRDLLSQCFEHMASSGDFSEVTLTQPTAEQWTTIRCLNVLLEPFAEATTCLSGQSYPTLVVVVPVLRMVQRKLANAEIFKGILGSVKNEAYAPDVLMLMQIVRYLYLKLVLERLIDKLPAETFWISQLDPRADLMKHLGAVEREYASECFLSAAIEMAKDMGLEEVDERDQAAPENTSSKRKKEQATSTCWADVFCCNTDEVAASETNSTLRERCESERQLYLADACKTSSTTDPLVWWEGKEMRYPILASLGRKWLGCIATSVPSERAFSTSGNLVTLKRCSLAPNIIRDTLFVGQNYEEGDGSDMDNDGTGADYCASDEDDSNSPFV